MSADARRASSQKKEDDGKTSHDPFGTSGAGVERYEDFIRHFPLHSVNTDSKNFMVSFSYQNFALELNRYGTPHISDLLFPMFPGVMYHMTNKNPKTGQNWLFDVREHSKGKPYSEVSMTVQLTVDPAVYKKETSMANMSVDMRAYRAGAMNTHLIAEFYTTDRSQKLLHYYINLVLFDLDARVPVRLPESLVNALPTLDISEYPINRLVSDPAPPTDVFRYHVTVVWGHLDCNGHMSFHWYPRHAMDAIVMAITSGASSIKSLSTADLEAGTHRLRLQYVKECCYGDKLELLVWQQDIPKKGGGVEKEARCWLQRDGEVVCKIAVKFI